MFRDAGFEYWYPPLGDDDRFSAEDFGLASLEGGDVEIVGRGTVLIGLSERTTGRMIELLARALFASEAAERVIACVMTKDRAHMGGLAIARVGYGTWLKFVWPLLVLLGLLTVVVLTVGVLR